MTDRHSEAAIAAHKRAMAELISSGEFALETVVVDGETVTAFASAEVNVVDVLLHAERRFHGDTLVVDADGTAFSYGEIFSAAKRLAASLSADHAIAPGDRIGIIMRNRAEWFIAFIAAMRLGAVAVLFNSRSIGSELAAAVTLVPCSLMLADRERARSLAELGCAQTIWTEDDIAAACANDRPDGGVQRVGRDAPAIILFTSGTTGGSRAVVLSQRNVTNMDRNIAFITALTLSVEAQLAGLPAAVADEVGPKPSSLLVFPLFHVSGLTAFLRAAAAGGALVLLRRWYPALAAAAIFEHRVSALAGPPLMLGDLLDLALPPEMLASVRALVVGGQATMPALFARAAEVMPQASPSIGWGMTEVSGAVTAAVGSLFSARPDSCGVVLPLTEIRAFDEMGAPLACGAVGELKVRGALVMRGYFEASEANRAAFRNGWLGTGDIGFVDGDGFVHLVDRKKDVAICGGENVYCGEVERALGKHRDVTEAIVFGIPDERLGERIVAIVGLNEGSKANGEDLRDFVAADLASYKVPSLILTDLPSLPRNATGKVNKAGARAMVLERIGAPAAPRLT
jgi:acyl-CoA synthetase (AMP-forming)/AMP-acid ligase II